MRHPLREHPTADVNRIHKILASDERVREKTAGRFIMLLSSFTGLIAAALLFSGLPETANAQTGPARPLESFLKASRK